MVEAILTTCVTTSLLVPTEPNYEGVVQKYVSGVAVLPNPVDKVIAAARDEFGKEPRSVIPFATYGGRTSVDDSILDPGFFIPDYPSGPLSLPPAIITIEIRFQTISMQSY